MTALPSTLKTFPNPVPGQDTTTVLPVYVRGNDNLLVACLNAVITALGGSSGATIAATYTPTLTGATNVAAVTAYASQWQRVGGVVTVSGKLDVTSVGAGTTQVGVSLPVASALATAQQAAGTGVAPSTSFTPGLAASILADAAHQRAQLEYTATGGNAETFAYHFTYLVV